MKYLLFALLMIGYFLPKAQTNNFPLYSSGVYSGGSGDVTNVTNAQLKLQATLGYIRVPHLSASSTVSAVFNFETGKNVYWGEPGDLGVYIFRGRNLATEGNLGIGTTTTGGKLDINAGSQYAIRTATSSRYVIEVKNTGDADGGWWLVNDANGDFALHENAVGDKFTIKPGGNIGIGTSSADSKLTINGNLRVIDPQVPSWNIGFGMSGDPTRSLSLDVVNSAVDTDPLELVYNRGTGVSIGSTGATNKFLRVYGPAYVDGYTGIGTASPSARLNIQQTSGAWNDGVRLSLMSKNWDIVADSNGDRLIIAKDQNMNNGLVLYNGNVGIGSSVPNQKLTVNGTIYGTRVKVDLTVPGPDYVFEKDYDLPSLEEIKKYIDEHKHLEGVPSAKEMEANGINVGEMNMLLLKKIEELTLYLVEQNEINTRQQETIDSLKEKINLLEKK